MSNLILSYLRRSPVDYGKHFLARRVTVPDKTIVYRSRSGINWELDLSEYQMRQIYLYDIYERNTIRHLFNLCKPDMTFIDVGANIGFYSLTMAQFLKKGEVHSFEPNPYIHKLFQKNLALNSFSNIVANPVGLSDKNETLTIHFSKSNLGASSVYNTSSDMHEQIRLVAFDDYCKEKNIQKIDLLKVDIEGGELNFLKGATGMIRKCEKLILVMEIMEEHCIKAGYSAAELFEYVTSLGFKAYLPRPYPFSLKRALVIPEGFNDNIIFLKGY